MTIHEININSFFKRKNLNTSLIKQALAQADKSHSAQKRFDGTSVFIGHVVPVAIEVISAYESEDKNISEVAVAAALLHDTVEDDPDFSELQLRKTFPKPVADIVMILTKPPQDNQHRIWGEEFFTATQKILKLLENSSYEAKLVKLADRCVNLMTIDDFKDSRPEDFKRFVADTQNHFLPFAKKNSSYFYKRMKKKLLSLD